MKNMIENPSLEKYVDNDGNAFTHVELDDNQQLVCGLRTDGDYEMAIELSDETLTAVEKNAKDLNMSFNDYIVSLLKETVARMEKEHKDDDAAKEE